MKDSCTIKRHKDGITLVLDDTIPYEKLVEDICLKFATNRAFFGEVKLSLALEGHELSETQIGVIIEAIELNSDIKIIYYKTDNELKAIDFLDMDAFTNAQIIDHSIANKAHVQSDYSVVVLGDVKKFSTLSAKGNVIVLGTIEGEVRAGEGDEERDHFIVAGRIEAETVTIDGHTGEVVIRHRNLRLGRKNAEVIGIRFWNGQMHAEPLSSGILTQ